VRDQIMAAVRRTAKGLAEAYGIPAERMPTVEITESTPATFNDAALNERLRALATAALGKERVLERTPSWAARMWGCFRWMGRFRR
jgi:metal-dependent amidase/aminoacylase/carboxypeptidase family protein